MNSHGDNKRSEYSYLERWQVLPWTSHKIKHKLCQEHRAKAEIRTSAIFVPTEAQDHKTASCCPTSCTSCHPVQGICLFPDHDLQNTAIHSDISIKNAPVKSQCWDSSSPQGYQKFSTAVPTMASRRDTLRALLLLPPDIITGTGPELSIHALRTQGRRELLITASETTQMMFCLLSTHRKNLSC